MSIEPDFRDPTEKERELMARLLEPDFSGKETLARQLARSRVRQIDLEGSLEFELPFVADPAEVVKRVPLKQKARMRMESRFTFSCAWSMERPRSLTSTRTTDHPSDECLARVSYG